MRHRLYGGVRGWVSNAPLYSIVRKKIILRKRNLIETVFDYLKNKMNLEHTRHRSFINAFIHIISTLVAYSLIKNKPSTNFDLNIH